MNRATQTIAFTSTAPGSPTVGGPTYTVAATGGASGNQVTFTGTAGVCNVSGSTVSFVGTGSCQVAANQAGNNNYFAAPQVTQSMTVGPSVVNKISTTTELSSSNGSTQFTDNVTFTARVRRGGPAVSEGTVTFKDGSTVLAAGVPVSASGIATFSISSLSVATHAITASYNGTATYNTSTGSLNQTVSVAATQTTVADSPTSTDLNQAVTFTATVRHWGIVVAGGTVTFKEGSTVLAGPIPVNATGQASFQKSNLAAGNHTITAVYNPTSDYQTSSGSDTHTVRK